MRPEKPRQGHSQGLHHHIARKFHEHRRHLPRISILLAIGLIVVSIALGVIIGSYGEGSPLQQPLQPGSGIEELGLVEQAALLKAKHAGYRDAELDPLFRLKLNRSLTKLLVYSDRILSSDASPYQKALARFMNGDDGRALSLFSDSISLAQKTQNSRLLRAGINYRNGSYSAALEDYNALLLVCGDNSSSDFCAGAYWGLASSHYRLGEYGKAKPWADRVNISYFDGDWSLLELRGDIYFRNELCEEAMPNYLALFDALGYNIGDSRVAVNIDKYCQCRDFLGQLSDRNTCVLPDPVNKRTIVGKRQPPV